MSEEFDHAEGKPPHIDRLSGLWRRVYDRKIVQWSVAYVALAYAIQHGVVLTGEAFEWPHAFQQISMLLLALGLPVVTTCAWYHGERASRHISGPELTIITLLLAIGSLFFYTLVRPSEELAVSRAPIVQDAGVTAARTAAQNPGLGIAVAVMPFANLSGDNDQEYFSDGMTDEISGALAKIPDLRVAARSSAFQFKGKNQDARAIGQQLHATHLIEGSVRKAGDQLRISAELVNADDGVTIWSSSYDRQLKDVFAVQEDIARAIATSFHMTLGLKPGESLVDRRITSEAGHENFLRAVGLVRTRGPKQEADAIKLLEQLLGESPEFAPGWALLGVAYNDLPLTDPARSAGDVEKMLPVVRNSLVKAEAAAQRAIQLDQNIPDGYTTLGAVQARRGSYLAGLQLEERALALDPDFPEALNAYSNQLARLGYITQAIPIREKLLGVEPFVPTFRAPYNRMLFAAGRMNEMRNPGLFDNTQVLAVQGHFGDAADVLQSVLQNTPEPLRRQTEEAGKLLRTAPKPLDLPESLPKLGLLDWVYVYVGAPERYLDSYEDSLKIGYFGSEAVYLWAPAYHAVRQTERFKAFVRAAGMVDYWHAKGWPEFCHPTTGDDFVCD